MPQELWGRFQQDPETQGLTCAHLSYRLLSGRKIHSQEEALAVRPPEAWHGTSGTVRGGEGTAVCPWGWRVGTPLASRG